MISFIPSFIFYPLGHKTDMICSLPCAPFVVASRLDLISSLYFPNCLPTPDIVFCQANHAEL
jgi:hypothetical protein